MKQETDFQKTFYLPLLALPIINKNKHNTKKAKTKNKLFSIVRLERKSILLRIVNVKLFSTLLTTVSGLFLRDKERPTIKGKKIDEIKIPDKNTHRTIVKNFFVDSI